MRGRSSLAWAPAKELVGGAEVPPMEAANLARSFSDWMIPLLPAPLGSKLQLRELNYLQERSVP